MKDLLEAKVKLEYALEDFKRENAFGVHKNNDSHFFRDLGVLVSRIAGAVDVLIDHQIKTEGDGK